MRLARFFRFSLCLCTLISGSVFAWNATGHREVVAVAWSALDSHSRDRIQQLLAIQSDSVDLPRVSGISRWLASSC